MNETLQAAARPHVLASKPERSDGNRRTTTRSEGLHRRPEDTIVNVSETAQGLRAALPDSRDFTQFRKNTDSAERFKIRLANSEGRRSSASYLIQKRYSWRGYAVSAPQLRPHQITLVASDDTRALATISVGFDSPQGLLVDDLYHAELEQLRAGGARVCEFTKLAVEPNERAREVLAMVFHIAYMYARRLHGCTDLLIEVNPRHVRFYRTALGFETVGAERTCPRVGAPAVLLRLDLVYAQEQITRLGGHRELAGSVRSLYPLGFSPAEEDGICGRLSQLG